MPQTTSFMATNSVTLRKNNFDVQCRACPRLANFLDEVKQNYPHYHARPVPPFGDEDIQLLIVGLAPGLHGANATGRPFTGDYAGILLYEALYEFGFSNQALAESLDDGLMLKNCRITNAVKCLPPENKPTGAEIKQCNSFLAAELASLKQGTVILALGTIAHQAVLKALNLKNLPFAHNTLHTLANGLILIDSYHTSRYNVQTKRLTKADFNAVFETILTVL